MDLEILYCSERKLFAEIKVTLEKPTVKVFCSQTRSDLSLPTHIAAFPVCMYWFLERKRTNISSSLINNITHIPYTTDFQLILLTTDQWPDLMFNFGLFIVEYENMSK